MYDCLCCYIGMENENLIPFLWWPFSVIKMFIIPIYLLRATHKVYSTNDLARKDLKFIRREREGSSEAVAEDELLME